MIKNLKFNFIEDYKSKIKSFLEPGFLDNPDNLWFAYIYTKAMKSIINIFKDKTNVKLESEKD